MQQDAAVPGAVTPPAAGAEPLLDAERLDVYHLAVEFQALASGLALGRGLRELRDQLDRASISIVLNIAEGGATSQGWRIERESDPPGQEPETP
jgi:hypothetical protein